MSDTRITRLQAIAGLALVPMLAPGFSRIAQAEARAIIDGAIAYSQ